MLSYNFLQVRLTLDLEHLLLFGFWEGGCRWLLPARTADTWAVAGGGPAHLLEVLHELLHAGVVGQVGRHTWWHLRGCSSVGWLGVLLLLLLLLAGRHTAGLQRPLLGVLSEKRVGSEH